MLPFLLMKKKLFYLILSVSIPLLCYRINNFWTPGCQLLHFNRWWKIRTFWNKWYHSTKIIHLLFGNFMARNRETCVEIISKLEDIDYRSWLLTAKLCNDEEHSYVNSSWFVFGKNNFQKVAGRLLIILLILYLDTIFVFIYLKMHFNLITL